MKKSLIRLAVLCFAFLCVAGCDNKQPIVNTIKTNAENAILSMEGGEVVNLPCSTEFPQTGRKKVLVTADGYRPEWIWLSPPQKESANEYFVEMQEMEVPVTLESIPSGASVAVDGEDTGLVTPATLMLNYGVHNVTFAKKGCEPMSVDVSVYSDAPRKESVRIISQLGLLNVKTVPEGADIFLGDEKIGVSDYSGYQMEGTYDLRIALDGYGEYNTKVDIVREEKIDIGPVDMKNLPGILKINCNVDDAEVFVDEKSVGKTPLEGIRLDPGLYTVTVRKEGYVEHTANCRIYPDKTEEISAELLSYYGSVEFTVKPAGTQVAFDGVFLGVAGESSFKIDRIEAGRHQLALLHDDIIPEDTPALFFVDLLQGEELVLSSPVIAPVANVEIVMENNKPWRGRMALPLDESAESVLFEPVEGGKITLRRESIQKIIPLNQEQDK